MLLLDTQFGKKVGGFSKDDCDEIFYPCLKRFKETCRPGCVWDILGLQICCYTFQFEIYGHLSLCLVHQACSA